MKKLNLILFTICFFSFQLLNAQVPNWIGGTGDWDDPSNWVNNTVPTAATNVLINNANSVITIPDGVNAVAKSVIIFQGSLTVNAAATLTITNSANPGGLQIGGAQLPAIAYFTNHGTTAVNSSTSNGIRMSIGCHFHNSSTGTVTIDGANYGFQAIDLDGSILNEGTLNITNTSLAGIRHIDGNGSPVNSFVNSATGTINITNSGGGMIVRNFNGVENSGSINIGTGNSDLGIMLQEGGFVHNMSTGQINILDAGVGNPTESIGVGINGGGPYPFTNDGLLCINSATVTAQLIDPAVTFTNNGTYNTTGCSASMGAYYAVPTMGEWSLIIFGLIVLSLGIVYVMRWQGKYARAVA